MGKTKSENRLIMEEELLEGLENDLRGMDLMVETAIEEQLDDGEEELEEEVREKAKAELMEKWQEDRAKIDAAYRAFVEVVAHAIDCYGVKVERREKKGE